MTDRRGMGDPGQARERARNLFMIGRLADACDAAREALAQDALDASTLRLSADIEAALGDLESALDYAAQAISVEASASSYAVLASIQRRAGDFAAAIASCERGLALDPEHVTLHVTASLAWAGPWLDGSTDRPSETRREAASQSAALAARALELDPTETFPYYAASVAELVRNDLYAAASILTKGLALDPEWVAGHLLMSGIRGRQGMVKLASRHLATAGMLSPNDETPISQLRAIAGKRRFRRNRPGPSIWWLAPEARKILEADAELGGGR